MNTKRIIITAPDVIKTATPTFMPSAKAKTENTGDFFAPRAGAILVTNQIRSR